MSAEVPATRRRKTTLVLQYAAPCVLVVGIGMSLLAARMFQRQVAQEQWQTFQHEIDRIEYNVLDRIRQYELALNGCRGLFVASTSVERGEFHAYFKSRQQTLEYPGSLGIGFIQRIKRSELATFQADVAADGWPGYTVFPFTDKAEAYAVKYLEPIDNNRVAMGYDIASDDVRREAAELARDSGTVTATRLIRVVQHPTGPPAVLLLLPYYLDDQNPQTVSARRANLVGWVYMPLIVEEMMRPVCDGLHRAMDFEILDGHAHDGAIEFFDRYEGDDDEQFVQRGDKVFASTVPLSVAGRTWSLRVRALPSFFQPWARWQSWAIGVMGAFLSVATMLALWSLGRQRRVAERLAEEMTQAARESEARFRAAAEGGRSAFFLFRSVRDENHRIVDFEFIDINRRGLDMIQHTREQVLGQCLCELLPINRAGGFFEKYKRVVETGELLEEAFELTLPDGKSVWLQHQVVAVGDGVAITTDDITDRKLADDELLAERTRLLNVIDGTRSGTWEWHVQTGKRIFNERWAEILGYTVAELIRGDSQLWSRLSHPDDWPRIKQALDAHFDGRTAFYDCELRMKHKAGHWVWVHDRGRVVSRDEAGRPLLMFGTHTDITERKQAEEQLLTERTRLSNVIDGTQIGTWEWHVQTGQAIFNKRWAGILGYTLAELAPVDSDVWDRLSHPDDLPGVKLALKAHFAKQTEYYDCELRMKHKDGHWVWIHDRGKVLSRDKDGQPLVMFGTHVDITKRKHAEQELRTLSQAVEQSAASIVVTNADGLIEYVNPAFCENTGYTAEEVMGQNPRILKGGTVDPQVYRDMWTQITAGKTWRGEFHNKRKDGSLYWELATISPVTDSAGRITHYVAVEDEISERKSMEQNLLLAATTDKLTGLANRASLSERLEVVLAECQAEPSSGVAVLFLDFDRFKTINDSLGHDAGDELLKRIANRLRDAIDDGCDVDRLFAGHAIARFGGDEFVIVLEHIARAEDALRMADRVLERLAEPYELNGYDIVSTASMGVVVGGLAQDGDAGQALTAADFLRDGDTAMYEAKLAGRGCYRVFDAAMRDRVQFRLGMESDLRKAVANNELFLQYQPIVDLQSGEVESFEALVRWQHPQRGLVNPAEFIPLAEETGIIHDIGAWVLRTACSQFVHWQTHGAHVPKSISVNLSPSQFNRSDLPDEVHRILHETGMPPQRLHLEVTETAVMSDIDHAVAVLGKLKQLGIKIDMDDFGNGHSSLACLRELPFDVLKIDRNFVTGLERNRDTAAMIQAVLHLAYNLGISVIAEGIETTEQVVILQALECGFGQGFLFARPMAADRVTGFEVDLDLLASARSA